MPDNPVAGKAGNLTRSCKILDYLNENLSQFSNIEFLSVEDWGDWDEKGIAAFKIKYPKIKLHLIRRRISKKYPIRRVLFYKLPNFFYKLIRGFSVNITSFYFNLNLRRHLIKNPPSILIMSYSSWADVRFFNKKNSYLILDTHDFLTAQNRRKKNIIGALFQSEINILNKYDELWTLSIEEKYIYEQFTDCKVVYHPVTFQPKELHNKETYKYDILYVASNNPHNIASIIWFNENVLPLLSDYKVHVVGSICSKINLQHPNLIKHGIVDDLNEFYDNAKLAICPMLSGTGVKIKVVEALANNIPVVTTTRGVDGLINKTENGCMVADDPVEFANKIKSLMTQEVLYKKMKTSSHTYINKNHNIQQDDILFETLKAKL